ncbi:hypothetical protein FIBSPDRAFT_871535 [Athelia psychrophila]|uniref:Uncharacterized protein n=1 Tax=Athelia psychrophila TaxID=1759441 RepID=A0A166A8S5_9AGAM|nr:hypothetical protein FIBSPDRAFT_871535 [Fibularhizoctonia sp. CBS 109695]
MLGGSLAKSRHLPPTTTPTRQTHIWYAPFTSSVHLLDGSEEEGVCVYRHWARSRVGSVKALIDVSRVQPGKEWKEVDRY